MALLLCANVSGSAKYRKKANPQQSKLRICSDKLEWHFFILTLSKSKNIAGKEWISWHSAAPFNRQNIYERSIGVWMIDSRIISKKASQAKIQTGIPDNHCRKGCITHTLKKETYRKIFWFAPIGHRLQSADHTSPFTEYKIASTTLRKTMT
ncbi:MAG TPA: hypothetical protein ACQGQH_05080 [Xylella sp.]